MFEVQVTGFVEFEKALRILPEHWKDAERIWRVIAAKTIIVRAKDNASEQIGEQDNRIYHKIQKDIKVGGIGIVRYGGKPYDFGAEYGSYQYHQFPVWRGNGIDAGYFFWPAVRDFSHIMADEYFATVWHEVKKAFPGYS